MHLVFRAEKQSDFARIYLKNKKIVLNIKKKQFDKKMTNTFRTIASMVAISATMIMAASCAKDDFAEDGLKNTQGIERYVSASATLPEIAVNDKAYLDATDHGKVKWDIGDVINLNGTELTVTGVDDGDTKAYFDGTIYAIADSRDELYWAVYPKNLMPITNSSTIPNEFGKDQIYFNYPSTQTFDASKNPLQNCTYMAGFARVPQGSTDLSFKMKNLGSVMRITLQPKAGETNTKVSKLVLSSNMTLAGRCRIDNGEWGLAPQGSNTEHTLEINLTDGIHNYIDIAGGATVYVLICSGYDAFNLTMKAYNTDGYYAQMTSSNIKLKRSSIYTSTIKNVSFNRGISVAANQIVEFAPGNLQWSASGNHEVAGGGTAAGQWRFAEHQWDFVGDASHGNVYNGSTKYDNANIASDYTGYIDLFCWATSGYNNKYPYMTSQTATDYGDGSNDITGTNYDWGVYNAITNPQMNYASDAPGTWRTPTIDEWEYVLNTRSTTSGIRFAKATVNGVDGLIIVPDNWSTSTYTLNNTNTQICAFSDNTITLATWNTLENAGCVFLPVTGDRSGTSVGNFGDCNYWSITYDNGGYDAYLMYVGTHAVGPAGSDYRYFGFAVRLIRDLN